MKKRNFVLLSLLFILFFCFNGQKIQAKNNQEHVIYEKYATIVSANYVDTDLVIKLEIDEKIYTGKFIDDIDYDDYLFFHHNEGITINVTYYFEKQELRILKWFS